MAIAILATVALPLLLGVINAIADDRATAKTRTENAIRPVMLTDDLVAFRIVGQGEEIDQLR